MSERDQAEVPRHFYFTPVLGGPGAPRYPVTHGRQTIGRSEDAEIALLEPTVSRRHATVELVDAEVWLEDLESKHGTFVNSRRVRRSRLKPGDIVVFGLSIVLRLEVAEHAVPPAMPLKVPVLVGPQIGTPASMDLERGRHVLLARTASAEAGLLPPDRRGGPSQELDHLKEEMVHLRRLAGVGVQCGAILPLLLQRLTGVRGLFAPGSPQPEPDRILADLELVHNGLDRILDALQISPLPRPEPVDLSAAVQQAIEELTASPGGHSYETLTELDDRLTVLADGPRLERALCALLRTARRNSYEGTPVRLRATDSLRGVLVVIAFRGRAFAAETVAELARPFGPIVEWRRLGPDYFEAQQIVMSLGGTVTMESAAQGIHSFHVILPAAAL